MLRQLARNYRYNPYSTRLEENWKQERVSTGIGRWKFTRVCSQVQKRKVVVGELNLFVNIEVRDRG